MKKISYDPILTEMHAIKDEISAEFNHDIDALFAHLHKVQAKAVSEGKAVVTTPKGSMKRPVSRFRRKSKAKVNA